MGRRLVESLLLLRHAPHQVELVVRPHRGHVGHAVAEAEERRHGADVPDVLVIEAEAVQQLVVGVADRGGIQGHLHREVEHGFLPRRYVGLAVVDRDLVGDQRTLRPDAQDRAVGDHAVLAAVGVRRGDHDHFPLGLGQAAVLFHQRVMEGEEGAPLGGTMRQGEEDVGNEAGFFLHLEDAGADVRGQVFQFGYRVAADGWCAHDVLVEIVLVSGYFRTPQPGRGDTDERARTESRQEEQRAVRVRQPAAGNAGEPARLHRHRAGRRFCLVGATDRGAKPDQDRHRRAGRGRGQGSGGRRRDGRLPCHAGRQDRPFRRAGGVGDFWRA